MPFKTMRMMACSRPLENHRPSPGSAVWVFSMLAFRPLLINGIFQKLGTPIYTPKYSNPHYCIIGNPKWYPLFWETPRCLDSCVKLLESSPVVLSRNETRVVQVNIVGFRVCRTPSPSSKILPTHWAALRFASLRDG